MAYLLGTVGRAMLGTAELWPMCRATPYAVSTNAEAAAYVVVDAAPLTND
jgi:hypothetical protein